MAYNQQPQRGGLSDETLATLIVGNAILQGQQQQAALIQQQNYQQWLEHQRNSLRHQGCSERQIEAAVQRYHELGAAQNQIGIAKAAKDKAETGYFVTVLVGLVAIVWTTIAVGGPAVARAGFGVFVTTVVAGGAFLLWKRTPWGELRQAVQDAVDTHQAKVDAGYGNFLVTWQDPR